MLKLHRDAQPGHGELRGRLEHIASGDRHDFASAESLVDWLLRHAARTRPRGVSLPSPIQESFR